MRPHQNVTADTPPPESLRALFKKWQRSSPEEINSSRDVIDLSREDSRDGIIQIKPFLGRQKAVQDAIQRFLERGSSQTRTLVDTGSFPTTTAFELKTVPGLFVFPSLLMPDVQVALLGRLLHRDLSNPVHKTNVHLFHHIVYPSGTDVGDSGSPSFFAMDPGQKLHSKDASVHKAMTIERMLQRKLRWITLGGQYDWTAKVYPDEEPPEFPPDIAQLLRAFFPDVEAEAAIVNFYNPGDTLSVHRDVSEECDQGLISISIGCDGLFVVGIENGSQHAIIRLRSGDAVLMTGESRFAWHAVPKVLADTCPKWLESWPACSDGEKHERWRDWMKTKRINLNARQMRADYVET